MKTFSELAECLAQIPPKITLHERLFKYNYVGRLQLLIFSTDLLFAIKRDGYIFKERGWVCRFPKHQNLNKWAIAAEKRHCPKLHTVTDRGTQRKYSSKPLKHSIVKRILVFKRQIQAYFYPLKIFHLFGFPS